MTWSTSDVAVCCSSDSVSSRVRCCSASNSRVFSMAITAWSAKVFTSSICLSVKGRRVDRTSAITPTGVPSLRSGTPSIVRYSPSFAVSNRYSGSLNVVDMDDVAFQQRAADARTSTWFNRQVLQILFVLLVMAW